MSSKDSKYGICSKNGLLKELGKSPNPRTVLLGQIVKIDGTLAAGTVVVRFLKETDTWEATTFCCTKDLIIPIPEKLWPYIAAITSPQERVKLAKNTELCNKLKLLSKDVTVGFTDTSDVCLGTIRYMGSVKGMGYCFGIELNEKRRNNNCQGSCAGIQYFNCRPGHAVFTTIDRIAPWYYTSQPSEQPPPPVTDLDRCLQKNINSMLNGTTNSVGDKTKLYESNGLPEKPKYENIVTKYGDYSKGTNLMNIAKSSNTPRHTNGIPMRNSLSLQNILDIDSSTINTNNDFDQNTMIQPEKTQLVHESKVKSNKPESALMEILGHTLNYVSDGAKPSESSTFVVNHKKNLDKNDNVKEKYTMIGDCSDIYSTKTNTMNGSTVNNSNNASSTPTPTTTNNGPMSNHHTQTLNNNRGSRNKSMNPLTHLLEGNNTLRRSKFYTDYIENGDDDVGNAVKAVKSSKKLENGKYSIMEDVQTI